MSLDDLPCSYNAISNPSAYGFADSCDFVRQACADQTSTVYFFNICFCNLQGNPALTTIVFLIILILAFYFLSTTAEDYVEPALASLGQKLNFSKPLTGVTLVALANGLPDIITAFESGSSADSGLLLPIGSLLGAGVFTTTIVLARCLWVAPEGKIVADQRSFKRDILFFIFGLGWIAIMGIFQVLNIVTGMGFIIIYVCFMVAVLIRESNYEAELRQLQEEQAEEDAKPLIEDTRKPSHDVQFYEEGGLLDPEKIKENYAMGLTSEVSKTSLEKGEKGRRKLSKWSIREESEYGSFHHEIHSERREDRLGKKGITVYYVITYPFDLVRRLTIPASDQMSWDKRLALVQPFTAGVFLIWRFGDIESIGTVQVLIAYLLTALLFTVLVWKYTTISKFPEGLLSYVFIAFSLVASILWVGFLAGIVVDFIAFISVMSKLPVNYLGLSIVAWGNSLNDFFVDGSLAKKGLGEVSISGIFAGQFFNMCIGFGLSLIRQNITLGHQSYSILTWETESVVTFVLMIVMLMSLVATLIYGSMHKYTFYKKWAWILTGIYFAFFIGITAFILTRE